MLEDNHSSNHTRLAFASRNAKEVSLFTVTLGRNRTSKLVVIHAEVVMLQNIFDFLLLLYVKIDPVNRQIYAHLCEFILDTSTVIQHDLHLVVLLFFSQTC